MFKGIQELPDCTALRLKPQKFKQTCLCVQKKKIHQKHNQSIRNTTKNTKQQQCMLLKLCMNKSPKKKSSLKKKKHQKNPHVFKFSVQHLSSTQKKNMELSNALTFQFSQSFIFLGKGTPKALVSFLFLGSLLTKKLPWQCSILNVKFWCSLATVSSQIQNTCGLDHVLARMNSM